MDVKIQNALETLLVPEQELLSNLKRSDLKGFEDRLYSYVLEFYNRLCECFLDVFCKSSYFKSQCESKSQEHGSCQLKARKVSLRICTGSKVSFSSPYMVKVSGDFKGDRHLFHQLFDTVGNNSPSYTSRVAQQSVMAPSFEVGVQLLEGVGVCCPISRSRSLSLKYGKELLANRVGLQLAKGESLKGKHVLLAMDGGRGRTREYNGKKNEQGTHELYNTPWREPKLLVIHTIDRNTGTQSKEDLPLYDCCFGDDECFELLGAYLKTLEIEKASHVQFVADGAVWIWNRVQELLLGLGVEKRNITETLDYYHAAEHLGKLIEELPRTVDTPQRVKLRVQCKELLWEGKVEQMINLIRQHTQSKRKPLMTEIKYFLKHKFRCRYGVFRNNKLCCGSGIVESGIRRVINLRFKAPSSFWKIENLEPLIYLRAAFLAKRWDIIWKNRLLFNGE